MKFIIAFIFSIIVGAFVSTSTSNAYLHTTLYEVVIVEQGDDVWNIAKKYVSDKEDIREFISVINKINNLDKNSRVFPGQELRIPINEKINKNKNAISQKANCIFIYVRRMDYLALCVSMLVAPLVVNTCIACATLASVVLMTARVLPEETWLL
ncbi:MAG: Peptidoglycan-binding lysin protein [Firmicutes bacterium]|nr:Peptidoglycan-binding lysin protein [Bacillota bacterium]